MDSRSAAHVLSEIAAFLAFRAENRFKARAYRNAAKAVLALNADDLTPLYRSGELAGVRGLGRATLAVLSDLIENGESRYLEQLRQHVPEGVIDLLRVPGLTPVRIQQIHEALGVASVDELEAAARDGRLATVRGFGEKTSQNLLAAIDDWDLFLAFQLIDNCTAGKPRAPIHWFFQEIAGKVPSKFTAADILP